MAHGMKRGSSARWSGTRTSIRTGASGVPTRRESCATVISWSDGMDVLLEQKWPEDAMFRLSPHEVPARNPSRSGQGGTQADPPGCRYLVHAPRLSHCLDAGRRLDGGRPGDLRVLEGRGAY